ncbi:MAG TPA: tetratricopeptide repeat protein, partial [Chthoniobacterales bacterium]|nr:tetratricopeptide repeat protein [Chthoniobacterales bacterium]
LHEADASTGEGVRRIRQVIDAKGNIDGRTGHFVGRGAELRRLRETVAFGKVGVLTVLNGPDGIGKTALAVKYGRVFAHEYPGGCWQVRCRGREDLRAALAGLAGSSDLDFSFTEKEKRDLDLSFERVVRELKHRAESVRPSCVLLLLDDVDKPKLLEPEQGWRLPSAEWLHVIATTPLEEYELLGRQKERAFLTLNELPEEEALALVRRYQPDEKFPDEAACDAAKEIVRMLGGFTLAVEQAAVFLGRFARDVNFSEFLNQLKREGLTGLEEFISDTINGSSYFEECLRAATRPTLVRLGEAERVTLSIAALMPADHVALPWVRTLVSKAFPELAEDQSLGPSNPWQELLQRLFDLQLLQPAAEGYEARMHRLVQEVVKRDAGEETVQARGQALMTHVEARAKFLWEGWVRHEHRWELVPLVASAWQYLETGVSQGAYLANQAFGPLRNLGNFAEAELLLRRALAFDERNFGLSHPNVATCLNNLAALLYDTNRLEGAKNLYRRALAIDEQSFGPDDPRVATCLNNLAALLHENSRPEEAEPLFRRALDIDERRFGPKDPRVATHLNNLALLLKATDRPDEAELLYRQALAIDEEGVGLNHPRVASHLNNLAQLLQALNRLEEAEPLYRRALAIDEQSFGPDDPRVATHLNNLALLLKATERLGEAERLYRRALAIDEQHFGWDHPSVGTDLNNLAALLEATNRLDEAEQLMRLMLGIFLRSSASTGHEHPFLQTGIRNYAALLGEIGHDVPQILARLNDLAHRFGVNFSSDALFEIARQSQEHRMPRSQRALSDYCATLASAVRKALALLGFTGSRVHREHGKQKPEDRPK